MLLSLKPQYVGRFAKFTRTGINQPRHADNLYESTCALDVATCQLRTVVSPP